MTHFHQKFFQYTQKLLNLYEREKKVNLISGYNYLSKSKHDGPFYFSKYTNIWGWATWKNRWENRVTLNEENLNKFKNSDLSKVFSLSKKLRISLKGLKMLYLSN
ncbi:hypothetical protein CM15mP35_04550 [bacterium]|nr:MAG: hypothetical protein CM15mV39_0870 [uncultured marine virus]GIR20194.1 MAG: hypothetical protein CM15mP35_04550 [bacterium]